MKSENVRGFSPGLDSREEKRNWGIGGSKRRARCGLGPSDVDLKKGRVRSDTTV